MSGVQALQVAVAIIKNTAGEILLSYRHEHLHQGNLWEFPGGKFKAGENAEQALVRELHEELNIVVEQTSPTLVVEHQYPEKRVRLHVWTVTRFSGAVVSCQGQEIRWVRPELLNEYTFPAANRTIITAARLPAHYAILAGNSPADTECQLQTMLDNGIRLIQLRTKNFTRAELQSTVKACYPLCQDAGAELLLNSDIQQSAQWQCDGVHLTGRHLMALTQRPNINACWVAASCHDPSELLHAQTIGVDFVVLAPVKKTTSHANAKPLGWQNFSELVAAVNIPVYALGGMEVNDLIQAHQMGAQGIAGISAFLPSL